MIRKLGIALFCSVPVAALGVSACSDDPITPTLDPSGAGGAGGSAMGTGGTGGGAPVGGAGGMGVPVLGEHVPLMFNNGWVDGSTNSVGIQGSVFTAKDEGGSTITPEMFDAAGTELCVKGDIAQVVDAMYSTYWGAMVALNFNQPSEDTGMGGAAGAGGEATGGMGGEATGGMGGAAAGGTGGTAMGGAGGTAAGAAGMTFYGFAGAGGEGGMGGTPAGGAGGEATGGAGGEAAGGAATGGAGGDGAGGAPADTAMPWDAAAAKVIGFRYKLSALPPAGGLLRVQFEEIDGDPEAPFCVALTEPEGNVTFDKTFAKCWDAAASKTPDITKLKSIAFSIVANETAAYNYDFCIEELSAIVAE